MKGKPKFFCESCGTEVKQNDKICTHCGKFFASVKCPSCGYSGDSRAFRDGCPACGYAVLAPADTSRALSSRKKKPVETDPLPVWIYIAALALLAGLVAMIILQR